MIYIKQLRTYTIIGILFAIITGAVFHFIYEWTGNNFFAGLIFPVNESVWEHMKLIFFPMLLYSFIMRKKLDSAFPCISSALSAGIITGTLLVPIIFYTYTGIIGYDILVMDFLTFAISIIIAFLVVYKLTLSCMLQSHSILLHIITGALFVCFVIFSVCPPAIELFKDPVK